jgi:digeranylgeranylglycerophospholipid reductase
MEGFYDTIIVGGSFAGLATARFTEAERILILEKEREIGLRQRSACAAPASWVERLGCDKSILERFDSVTFHSMDGSQAVVDIPEEFCTIDYGIFCNTLAGALEEVEIRTGTRVTGLSRGFPKKVYCDNQVFHGKIVVDASGWRAVTASHLGYPGRGKKTQRATGIETVADYEIERSLHLYYGKSIIPGGYAWIFPVGKGKVRVGLGSYYLKTDLKRRLDAFMVSRGMENRGYGIHGGVIPCGGLGEPVLGDVFFVGDSGGQVIPVTAEGIRPAFENARVLGGLISKVMGGEMGLSRAVEEYRESIYSKKGFYSNLALLQKVLYRVPDGLMARIIQKVSVEKNLTAKIVESYFNGRLDGSPLGVLGRAIKYLGTEK